MLTLPSNEIYAAMQTGAMDAAITSSTSIMSFRPTEVSKSLTTAPIVLPPLRAAGFDLVWFGVIMTIVMEMGLIHPPVGLNIFVIKNIAPEVPLGDIIRSVLPFITLMVIAIVLRCVFPGLCLGLTRLAH